jgi:hypothetical protein
MRPPCLTASHAPLTQEVYYNGPHPSYGPLLGLYNSQRVFSHPPKAQFDHPMGVRCPSCHTIC